MKKIGLFGGTFDPVHLGHLLVAQAAIEETGLDRVWFIPAARSPFKPEGEPAPGPLRLRLLRLALAGCVDCAVDDQELTRGGISYTIDTVRRYGERFAGAVLHTIVGADHIAKLPSWRDAEELAARTRIIVVSRPGAEQVDLPSPFQGSRLHGIPFGVSSSVIRDRVRSGRAIESLTGPHVAEAIRKNRLYL